MTPKEKAIELVKKMLPQMYCYMGSGMLSNEYDIDVAVNMAKQCVQITIDEIDSALREVDWMEVQNLDRTSMWWQTVLDEVNKITSNDIKI